MLHLVHINDPISPFLFLVVIEALSSMIAKAVKGGDFEGVRLPNNGSLVSHLFYADDVIIFGEWSSRNIVNMVRFLWCFHACSWLRINLSKSNLYGVGVDGSRIEDLASVVGCIAGSFSFRYLSLILGANMNRVNNWRSVYEVFEPRLSTWKAFILSVGRKLTLIKSVLENLPNYYFSLYKSHVKVIND
ncbi:uncharacterized protein LOC110919185 [Helianthus annuus]|uniref:uncharacterized protein LOC110919185 n=1 Tax=Helianthus annuus TaxID=4232 RepID=UPI000B9002DF|nr:uncharacterized protein LOC110919185 [Helianthus annuus]